MRRARHTPFPAWVLGCPLPCMPTSYGTRKTVNWMHVAAHEPSSRASKGAETGNRLLEWSMGTGIGINWRPLPVKSKASEMDGCTHWIRLSRSRRPPLYLNSGYHGKYRGTLNTMLLLMALTTHPPLDGGVTRCSRSVSGPLPPRNCPRRFKLMII